MSEIRVRPERLQELSQELSRVAFDLQERNFIVSISLNDLNWQVKAKAEIMHLSSQGNQMIKSLGDTAEEMSRFLASKAEQFLEADRQGAAGFRAINGGVGPGLNSSGDGPGQDVAPGQAPATPAVPHGSDGSAQLEPSQYGIQIDNDAFLAASKRERMEMLMPAFKKLEAIYGVPWQIQAAQFAIESGWGEHRPADLTSGQESYNLFGMKGAGPAGTTTSNTTEHLNGKNVAVKDGFRAYNGFGESVIDHAALFEDGRYDEARRCRSDLRCWCEQLGPKGAGYATSPEYPKTLWNFMKSEGWVK